MVGPDAYRSLPQLAQAEAGVKGSNTKLSTEETYEEISPVRLDKSGVSAFVAIMRGCNNFCSYCVVPIRVVVSVVVVMRRSWRRYARSSTMDIER